MKRKLNVLLVLAFLLVSTMISGCGVGEAIYDESNYESLTNEKGDIQVISGGKIIFEYKNATILYSSSDTQAMLIKTSDGKKKYLQGDVVVDLY